MLTLINFGFMVYCAVTSNTVGTIFFGVLVLLCEIESVNNKIRRYDQIIDILLKCAKCQTGDETAESSDICSKID